MKFHLLQRVQGFVQFVSSLGSIVDTELRQCMQQCGSLMSVCLGCDSSSVHIELVW